MSGRGNIMKITNIGWSIGTFCNAKCKHCYSWKTRMNVDQYLTKEEIDIISGRLIKFGIQTVNLGGNEPIFTHGPDPEKSVLPYIIRKFTEANIPVGITTNGYTAIYLYETDKEVFKMVNDWDFSLDSLSNDEHNKNRGIDCLDWVKRGLSICSKEGSPKSLVLCGMNWNLNEQNLFALLQFARENQAEIRINTLKPTQPHHFELLPSIEQIYRAFSYLFNNTKTITLGDPVFGVMTEVKQNGCACGDKSFRILPKNKNGEVQITPCVYLIFPSGNLLSDDVENIIKNEEFSCLYNRKVAIPQFCKDIKCRYIEECRGGCASRAYLISGSLDQPDPYCPILYQQQGLELPSFKKIELQSVGIRVHDNYLCTWIGEPLEI